MLIEFRVENHRSILTEQALTMEAGRVGEVGDARLRRVGALSLLPVAALFGANASGKSNVLSAIGFLRDAILDSHAAWPPSGGVPRDAFAWGVGPLEPSLFEVTYLLGEVRFQYGFTINQTRVLEEWLFAWPKGRRQSWFERDADRFRFGDHLRGENRSIAELTRTNALFLSTAAQHQHEQLMPHYEWSRALRTVRVEGYRERFADAIPASAAASMFAALAAASAAEAGSSGWVRLNDMLPRPTESADPLGQLRRLDDRDSERLRRLLQAADVGITQFKLEGSPGPGGARSKDPSRQVSLLHQTRSGGGWLTLERESLGTKALFQLGPLVLDTLRTGGVLIVDELESSLHSLLALEIVRLFNDPDANPNNAQLIFTTHDTALLGTATGEPPLRRDQVWLTEKDPEGATQLTPLTDFKPRKEENLERGYLQGRYGAVPILGPLVPGKG